jgi:hypothetical protein
MIKDLDLFGKYQLLEKFALVMSNRCLNFYFDIRILLLMLKGYIADAVVWMVNLLKQTEKEIDFN